MANVVQVTVLMECAAIVGALVLARHATDRVLLAHALQLQMVKTNAGQDAKDVWVGLVKIIVQHAEQAMILVHAIALEMYVKNETDANNLTVESAEFWIGRV